MAPTAELECRVANTWWPVMAARTAMAAVSSSRISPTRIISGSWRNIERMPSAKPSLAAALADVCLIMEVGYSTGSSRVMILTDSRFRYWRIEYKVVVLPLPVGPVTRIRPSGRSTMRFRAARSASPRPSWSRATIPFCRSSTRRTIFSPCSVGSVDTRKSTCRPDMVREIRPSCGKRDSAMSSPAITFTRTASADQ